MTGNFKPWKRGNNRSNTRSYRNIAALPASTEKIIEKGTGIQTIHRQTTRVDYTSYGNSGYWQEQTMLKAYDAINLMDKNLLFLTLSVQSASHQTYFMEKFIYRFVDKLIDEGQDILMSSDGSNNIYITKGKAEVYPTMVAHMDTVHSIVPSKNYQIRSDGERMWAMDPQTGKNMGIGGDDKIGIFIALAMLRDLPVFKCVFFVDEEIGCVGSGLADITFFDNSSLVLQCDRKGTSDFVDNIMGTPLYGEGFAQEVEPILTRFGYTSGDGGMTDVWQLKENGLKVACANMSAGYFRPHTSSEYIGIATVQRCYDLCFAILTEMGNLRWEHIYDWKGESKYAGWYDKDDEEEAYYRYWVGGDGEKPEKFGTDTIGQSYLDVEDRNIQYLSDLRKAYPHLYEEKNNVTVMGNLSVSQLLAQDRDKIAAERYYAEMYLNNSDYDIGPACPNCGSEITVIRDEENEWYCVGCSIPVVTDGEFSIIDSDDETEMPEAIVLGHRVKINA